MLLHGETLPVLVRLSFWSLLSIAQAPTQQRIGVVLTPFPTHTALSGGHTHETSRRDSWDWDGSAMRAVVRGHTALRWTPAIAESWRPIPPSPPARLSPFRGTHPPADLLQGWQHRRGAGRDHARQSQ